MIYQFGFKTLSGKQSATSSKVNDKMNAQQNKLNVLKSEN